MSLLSAICCARENYALCKMKRSCFVPALIQITRDTVHKLQAQILRKVIEIQLMYIQREREMSESVYVCVCERERINGVMVL